PERRAALRARRDHHRRPRVDQGRGRRRRPDRGDRRLRQGMDPGVRLLHDLRPDGARPRVPSHRSVREDRMTRAQKLNVVGFAALIVLLFAFPYLGTSGYQVSLASTVLIAAILAATVNFLAGDGGMGSLGHGAIAAAAAYGAGWSSLQGHSITMQVVVAMGTGLVVTRSEERRGGNEWCVRRGGAQ